MTSLQQQASEEELAHAERVSRRREDPSWNSVHGKGDRLIFHVRLSEVSAGGMPGETNARASDAISCYAAAAWGPSAHA